jgi:hypothetical protein
MSNIHENYNLSFNNRVISTGQVWKNVTTAGDDHHVLCYFIYQIQFEEDIREDYIPMIDVVVNQGSTDNVFASGTSVAEVGGTSTLIHDSSGYTQTIPTADFRAILQEYAQFLRTPPLNGTKVAKASKPKSLLQSMMHFLNRFRR